MDELSRMGASIKVEGNTAIVDGVNRITGATLCASDLRAGAALVIAGIVAEGTTQIYNIEKVDSGDERALHKFKLKVG